MLPLNSALTSTHSIHIQSSTNKGIPPPSTEIHDNDGDHDENAQSTMKEMGMAEGEEKAGVMIMLGPGGGRFILYNCE